MLERNRAEFDRCRITDYHKADKLGQGITIAVLDDNNKPMDFMLEYTAYPMGWNTGKSKQSHASRVIRVLHEVAPKARIVSLPYINEATNQQREESIRYIQQYANEINYVNCSIHEWADGPVVELERLNIPVICAAGNQNYDDKVNYPARYPWTVAVGALQEYRDSVAGYSNEGAELDCLGYTDIAIPTTTSWMEFGGTSASTPMVTGMLALLGKLDRQQVFDLVGNNCIDYYDEGHDWRSGHGLFILPEIAKVEDKEVGNMSKTVFIDPGHGGHDPGGVGNGLKEKDIALAIGKLLGADLERCGLKVAYSRTTDVFVDLKERGRMSDRAGADVFVSLHVNSAENPMATGFEVWTSGGQGEGDKLATEIGKQLQKDFPDVKFRADFSDGDLDKESNFTVLVGPKAPAVLVEYLFIVNPADARILRTKQKELAESTARGICRYLDVEYKDGKGMNEEMASNAESLKGKVIEADAKVVVRGKEIAAGIVTTSEGGRTLAEVRAIANLLGLPVSYDNKTKTTYID